MKKLLFLLVIAGCAGLTKPEPAKAQNPSALRSKPSALSPRHTELGKPLLTTWLPTDYHAAIQNWTIAQDNRGVMYFGNGEGILEYDGVSWRLIQFPNKNTCRSLAKDANGRIYAGGIGDFGYLAPDSVGQMRFVSLLPQVPEDTRDFADVWSAQIIQQNIFFQTTNYLFHWTPSLPLSPDKEMTMKIWQPDQAFNRSFVVNNAFYIREQGKGLMRMQGDSLQLVPGGEQFANVGINVMLSFRNDRIGQIFIGTRTKGLFLYDGQTFRPFKTEADNFLRQNPLYSPGTVLDDNRLLLNTANGGAVLLDYNGKLLQTIDRSSGLLDNTAWYVYSDPTRTEAQWLALNNGIARVEATGPFSTYDADRGLTSYVIKVQRHRGMLYAATGVGLFYLDATSGTFKPVNMPVTPSWDLLTIDGQLLAATADGVYAVNGDQAVFVRRSVNQDFRATVLHRSRRDSQRVFVGINGLASLRRENGVWRDEGRAPGIQDEIGYLVEMNDGMLWAGTQAKGVLRLTFPGNSAQIWQDVKIERFGPEHGLPDYRIGVYEINGTPYFTSLENIYRFDAENQRFVVDSTFIVIPSDNGWVLNEDERGRVWVRGKEMALGTRQSRPAGSYQWLKAPFRRLSDEGIYTIYSEENGVVWFGGADGIVRYDSNVDINTAADYPALVRRVVMGEDSVIFGGTVETFRRNVSTRREAPTLAYAHNNLRFAYSASAYEDASRLQFQIWLEGFDKEWSNWNDKTEKEYTNLPEGDYHFRVRAKNIYEHVSQEGVYSFTILPPWWRTWWAYGGYAVIFGLLVSAAGRVQRRRLLKKERERAEIRETKLRAQAAEAENKALQSENARKEIELQKTAELKTAYETLERTHENLKATQQQLVTQEKLASLGQLTAGIAHEIKNPLNFVNNFAQLSADLTDEFVEKLDASADKTVAEVRGELDDLLADLRTNNAKINEHGRRADGIVRAMMQHARGGKGERQPTDINELVEEYVNLAYHGMRAKVPDFNVSIERDFGKIDGKVDMVPQEIGRVLLNLLGNAFDAVREHAQSVNGAYSPRVVVSTRSQDGRVEIRVSDNGGGVPDDLRQKIFEPFFTTKPTGAGTGLGLSLSYDIVTQGHGGTLTMESTQGEGATFIITLPGV